MNTDNLKSIIQQMDTPAYIFDIDILNERIEMVHKCFEQKIGMCFSIKANPFLLGSLPDSFDHIEVCSPGELTICEKTGIDMGTVIYSGVNKGQSDIARAMDDGVGIFTAESMQHLTMIDNEAKKRNRCVPLLIRLTAGSQFGMDEQDILEIIKNRDDYSGVEIIGIHFFSGTQKRKVSVIEKELDYIDQFIENVHKSTGFLLKKIEYGTGLAVDYFSEDFNRQEMERLELVTNKLLSLSERYEITVEMGRFFAAPCGYYITKVVDLKTNCDIHYAIVDGGMNQLKYDGQLQGMQIPRIIHLGHDNPSEDVQDWTLCGSLCTTADILARNVKFKELEIGDILVFCHTGAYSCMEGMSIFLSREMPIIAKYSVSDGLTLLRKKIETDIFNTPCLQI